MVIAVDFDGTLCRDAFPAIGEMQPGADTALAALRREGHYIIINTCRRGDDLTAAVNWLLEQRIPFDRVNDNHPDLIARYGGNTRKIHADLYIDDHNLGGFPGWDATLHTIGSIWQDTDY